MAVVLRTLYKGYFWIMNDLVDPRTNEYLLVTNPLTPIFIIIVYLQLVLTILPKFMENRRAYDLRRTIVLFNFSQVLLNVYIFIWCGYEVLNQDLFCALPDYTNSPRGLRQLQLVHLYFISKVLDLVDTIFFVLRKKHNHLSFLHIFHHSGMVGLTWSGCRYIAGGQMVPLGLLNSFVHICMYSYYMLSAYDAKYKKFSASFKKHVTQLQLGQFIGFVIIYGYATLAPSCQLPRIIPFFLTMQAMFFVMLFGEFYYKAYIKKKKD